MIHTRMDDYFHEKKKLLEDAQEERDLIQLFPQIFFYRKFFPIHRKGFPTALCPYSV